MIQDSQNNQTSNNRQDRLDWLRELRRKFLIHLPSLLVLIPIFVLSEKNLTKAFAIFVMIAGAAHWYLDKRYLRRQKYKEALEGFKALLLNQKLEWKDRQTMKEFNRAEENFVRNLFKNFGREREKQAIALPAFLLMLGGLIANIFFGRAPLAYAILALAIGDTFSTVIGKKFGQHKLFWNREKSWEGFWAFVFATLIAAFAFSHLFPNFVFMDFRTIVFVTAFFGAIVESIPTVNDNFSIPIGVSLCLWVASLF